MGNRILAFLNLQDSNGNLSITNLAVYAALVKAILTPGSNLEDAGILLVAILNYSHKRFTVNSNEQRTVKVENQLVVDIDQIKEELEKVKSTTSALSIQSGFKGKM